MRHVPLLTVLLAACGGGSADETATPDDTDTETPPAPPCDWRLWYEDADGDGWGNESTRLAACEGPAGWVNEPGDCDDTDADAHPGLSEVCGNGRDDDCDGDVDVDDWFPDADADGWGDAGAGLRACEAPAGAIAEGGDCDDADPDVNPGATEACGNGRDDDCDGSPDACGLQGEWAPDDAGGDVRSEVPGAGLGQLVSAADVDGDGAADVWAGTQWNGAWLFGGPIEGDLALADARAYFPPAGANGNAVALARDADGDGYGELLVADPSASSSSAYAVGAVSLVHAPASGALTAPDAVFRGATEWVMATVPADGGDLDGDGLDEVVVATQRPGTGPDYAELFAWRSPFAAESGPGDAWATWVAEQEPSAVVRLGDTDGDGTDDYAIASDRDLRVYLLREASPGRSSLADLPDGLVGDADWGVGRRVAAAGDVDGDGHADVLAGVQGLVEEGDAVLLFSGAGTGELGPDAALAWIEDASLGAQRGGGDLDGDGLADPVVIGLRDGHWDSVRVLGPVSGVVDSEAAAWSTIGPIDYAATAIADVNGDGAEDLVLGLLRYGGTNDGGSLHVFYGGEGW